MSRVVRLEDVLAAVDAVRDKIAEIPSGPGVVGALELDAIFRRFAEALGPERDHDED